MSNVGLRLNVRARTQPYSLLHVLTLIMLLILSPLATANGDRIIPAQKPIKSKFSSSGKAIRVDRFAPKSSGKHPTIILLHGINGLGDECSLYYMAASLLAQRGYAVLLVHYFDRTATNNNDGKVFESFRKTFLNDKISDQEARKTRNTFYAWMDTVKDCITYARTLPEIDPNRIGFIGFSLGGFLATSVASQPGNRVGAVVNISGGMPEELQNLVENLPPLLIIHGDRDRIVPVNHVKKLGKLCFKKQQDVRVEILAKAGHGQSCSALFLLWREKERNQVSHAIVVSFGTKDDTRFFHESLLSFWHPGGPRLCQPSIETNLPKPTSSV